MTGDWIDYSEFQHPYLAVWKCHLTFPALIQPRPRPVSYTHLDVYKRQGHDCALGQLQAAGIGATKLVEQEARVGVVVYRLSLIHI